MKIETKLICMSLALLCSACDSSLGKLFQPSLVDSKHGPLTREEIQEFAFNMSDSIGDEVAECLVKEAIVRSAKLGDPETLDPIAVELLPVSQWSALGKSGKRLILTQVLFNQVIPLCTQVKGK
jgi:hypothetical protein